MRGQGTQGEIDPKRAKRMVERIIKAEKTNVQTRHLKDTQMVAKIKGIIREEAESYAY